jgi:integrase
MGDREKRRPNGSGSVFEARPGVWGVRWRRSGQRHARVGYGSREEADAAMSVIAKESSGWLPPDRISAGVLAIYFHDWLRLREGTHRTWRDDLARWRTHVGNSFGEHLEHTALATRRADSITAEDLEAFAVAKLRSGVSPATVGHCLRLLGRLYSHLVLHSERTGVTANPVRCLDKAVRRLYKPSSAEVPFIEHHEDIPRIIEALTPPYSVMFAVGVYAGLRPGEVKALTWSDIDLDGRRIAVLRQLVRGALSSLPREETRAVPIVDALLPVLGTWRERSRGRAFAFASVALSRGGRFKTDEPLVANDHTLLSNLDRALEALGMRRLTWYQATRHTFASEWMRNGGSIEALAAILGQSQASTRERYGRFQPLREAGASDGSSPGAEVSVCDLSEAERERIAML